MVLCYYSQLCYYGQHHCPEHAVCWPEAEGWRHRLLWCRIISQVLIYLSEFLHFCTPSQQLCFSSDTQIPTFCTISSSQFSSHQLQLPGTNSLFLSTVLPQSVLSNLPWKPFFFSETFSSVPLLWGTSVCGVHWIFVVKILVYCLVSRLRSRYVRCLLCLCQQWGCTLRAVREILQACVMLTALFFSGKKNYLPPSYLIYGFGFLFKVSVDVGHSSTVGYKWFLINMSSCVLCIILYLHCHILKELFCRLNFLWTWRGLKGHDLQ